MSPAIVLAIGIAIATALGVALVAARRAGGTLGPEADYGHELDVQPRGRHGRRATPAGRQRAMLAMIVAALAALGAGLATALSRGPH
jgi:hypothetical protein